MPLTENDKQAQKKLRSAIFFANVQRVKEALAMSPEAIAGIDTKGRIAYQLAQKEEASKLESLERGGLLLKSGIISLCE